MEVTYLADGVVLGSRMTDASGNFRVTAAQGAGGSLPASLDLFAIRKVALRDSSGDLLARASF